MGRFLIYFAYLGNCYSGVQRQNAIVHGKRIETVQGALEDALRTLNPANEVKTVLSSRTDRGVHALKNSCHVDLHCKRSGEEYQPAVITNFANYNLKRRRHDIRVLETIRVPGNFHARLMARGRKYVYRLGNLVQTPSCGDFLQQVDKYHPRKKCRGKLRFWGGIVGPLDMYKSYVYRGTLDMSKFLAAAALVSGIHDFSSFTTPRKNDAYNPHPWKMLTVGIRRAQPMGGHLQMLGHDINTNIEYWDIHIRAQSFMYKMVRRLVSAMELTATGVITLDDLEDILENPRHDFWFSSRMRMDEAGLFLVDVEYHPEDLLCTPEECSCVLTSPECQSEKAPEAESDNDAEGQVKVQGHFPVFGPLVQDENLTSSPDESTDFTRVHVQEDNSSEASETSCKLSKVS